MRRARIVTTLIGLALTIFAFGSGWAAPDAPPVSGIGILDYTRKPTFKVGDYVRYAVASYDDVGNLVTRYNLTVLIAGQDLWWGERCFYLETWVDAGKGQLTSHATLMSYAIFGDSLPDEHLQSYMRKMVMGYDPEQGQFTEILVAPKPGSLTSRPSLSEPHTVVWDTLGADTVQTHQGVLQALKVAKHEAWGKSGGAGDSSFYQELRETRTRWRCDAIPMTGTAREETHSVKTRSAWLIGRSKDAAPPQTVMAGSLTVRFIESGHGIKSRLLPADRVHSFDDPPAGKKPVPAARPKPAAGGARRR